MANPYPPNPNMHGMQPMHQQQPMQQMPPHQHMQQPLRGPNATRNGTSRAVPIVVSAGLAIGVFCGLLFGVGIPETTASPETGNNVKEADPAETTPTPTPSSSTATKPAATVAKPATETAATTAPTVAKPATAAGAPPAAGTTPAAGTPPGTEPAAGAASPTVAATPALKKVKLVVEITPDTVAATAKISVDKKDIEGGMTEIEIPADGKKEVKVVVKATGYKTVEQKVDIEGDVTVKVELIKRPAGGGTPGRPPTGGGKKKPAGGGLIDI